MGVFPPSPERSNGIDYQLNLHRLRIPDVVQITPAQSRGDAAMHRWYSAKVDNGAGWFNERLEAVETSSFRR